MISFNDYKNTLLHTCNWPYAWGSRGQHSWNPGYMTRIHIVERPVDEPLFRHYDWWISGVQLNCLGIHTLFNQSDHRDMFPIALKRFPFTIGCRLPPILPAASNCRALNTYQNVRLIIHGSWRAFLTLLWPFLICCV